MDSRLAAASLLLLLIATSQWQSATSFGAGSPASENVCTNMVPGHRNTTPRDHPSPFTLAPAQSGAAQGEPLNITLTSRHGFSFKGFLIQARAPNTQMPIGRFILHDSENTQSLACMGGTENAVTHTNPALKNSTTFEWIPPADFHGSVIFNATVVEDYSTYWTSVAANALIGDPAVIASTAGISTTQAPITTLRTSTTNSPVTMRPSEPIRALSPIYNGCGSTKTCFGTPANCESSGDCTFMMSAYERGTKYVFELMTSSPDAKYVAVGLSDDKSMGEDLVMECVLMDSGIVQVFQSWNVAGSKGNTRLPNNNSLQMLNSSYINGEGIYCRFEREAVTKVNDREFNLPNTQYHVLLAFGSNVKNGGAQGVGYHDATVASGNKKYLKDVNGFNVASTLLTRLHGAFMIGAWIGAASIGIVLARYFKQTWTGSQMCGKDQWFAWHRLLMVLVWSLTIAAFVLIFVELKAWSSNDRHAILGVITTALAFFQPIGAIFRPSPDSRRRPIFNWAHWFVGNCAHILGIVSIFLAGQLPKADLPKWWIWIMVGYVAFHVIMHLMLSIAGCISERQSSKRINSFPMKEMSNSRSPLSSADRKQEAPHACFRKFLLALYIFGILVVTIALVIIVALAPIEQQIKRISNSISNYSNSNSV